MIIVLIISFFISYYIDLRLRKVFEEYINIEVDRISNNIVNQVINEMKDDIDYNKFLIINNSNYISYDTLKINKYTTDFSRILYKKIFDLDNGDIDDSIYFINNKSNEFKKLPKGIFYFISLGSINNSIIFSNLGPKIPIKIVFDGQLKVNIDFKTKEYGINNVVIESYVVVSVKERTVLPFNSKEKDVIVKKPLSIDIINGNIPNYYSDFVKR